MLQKCVLQKVIRKDAGIRGPHVSWSDACRLCGVPYIKRQKERPLLTVMSLLIALQKPTVKRVVQGCFDGSLPRRTRRRMPMNDFERRSPPILGQFERLSRYSQRIVYGQAVQIERNSSAIIVQLNHAVNFMRRRRQMV